MNAPGQPLTLVERALAEGPASAVTLARLTGLSPSVTRRECDMLVRLRKIEIIHEDGLYQKYRLREGA